MDRIIPLPAFTDNYIWAWLHGGEATVVDPGDAAPVQAWLADTGARLTTILVTHWHPDHTGGIERLKAAGDVTIYGPAAESARIPTLDHALQEGDALTAGGLRFTVMEVPGHTLGHIAYFADTSPPVLFCGDTLFHTGCGRLFEGTPEQMYASLGKLGACPDDTRVYCTHEYTLANLAFARSVEQDNATLAAVEDEAKGLRETGQPTLPTTVGAQRRSNPFLRTHEAALQRAIAARGDALPASAVEAFARLREMKDQA